MSEPQTTLHSVLEQIRSISLQVERFAFLSSLAEFHNLSSQATQIVQVARAEHNLNADNPEHAELCKEIDAMFSKLETFRKHVRSQNLMGGMDLIIQETPPEQTEKYTIWWKDGTRSVIEGPTIEAAFTKAGFGAGAVAAIDWYDRGDVDTHYWCTATKNWQRRTPIFNPNA